MLILLKGYDDTFAQTVHARSSYTGREVLWGRKFRRMFEADPRVGEVILHLDQVSELEPVSKQGGANS